MSPEHANFMQVNPEMRDEFEEASGLNRAQIFHYGGFFDRSGDVVTYKPLEEATEKELKAGKHKTSKKHIVYGPMNPSPTDLRRKRKDLRGNETLEEARLDHNNGYTKKHRGKHRSHTRRSGMMAFFRKSVSFFGYRR